MAAAACEIICSAQGVPLRATESQDQQQEHTRTLKVVRWEAAGNWGKSGKPSEGKGGKGGG
eukprot:5322900-Karenia_brevis.AAC.1